MRHTSGFFHMVEVIIAKLPYIKRAVNGRPARELFTLGVVDPPIDVNTHTHTHTQTVFPMGVCILF